VDAAPNAAAAVTIDLGGATLATPATVTIPGKDLSAAPSADDVPVVRPLDADGNLGAAISGGMLQADGSYTFPVSAGGTYAVVWESRLVAAEGCDTAPVAAWSADNSQHHDGVNACHPPTLPDLGKSSLTYSCGDKSHSQLTFYYLAINPTASQQLKFYVDGTLYRTFGASTDGSGYYNRWQPVALTVPSGKHTYRWDATTDLTGQPPYWVDTMRCINNPVTPNVNGRFEFEEGFVPPEVTGTFVIDNSAPQAGGYSAHPPLLPDVGKASLTFSCGDKSHSQLTFYYLALNPTASQQLKFYVDGTLYRTFGASTDGSGYYNRWQPVALTVPSGKHTYRWDATTDLAGQPPYWIDTMRCLDNAVTPNVNGRFEFEEGFVPPEVTGTFVIDNSAPQAGGYSAHPPLLPDVGKASLTFSCGDKSHSQLTFYYLAINPTATQQLKFYVDGTLYGTYGASTDGSGYYNRWQLISVTLANGPHTYGWDAVTDLASQPPFWLDTIHCN